MPKQSMTIESNQTADFNNVTFNEKKIQHEQSQYDLPLKTEFETRNNSRNVVEKTTVVEP